MNKFLSLISSNGSATLKRRAEGLSTQAELAQQNLINRLKQDATSLKLDIDKLTDLAPNSKDSLRPGGKDWDPIVWAEQLQEAKKKLWQTNIQLQIAVGTFNEYFVDMDTQAPEGSQDENE